MSYLVKQIYMDFFENAHKQTSKIWDNWVIQNLKRG